jgi:tetratricopeptide (TPR) repeat protein
MCRNYADARAHVGRPSSDAGRDSCSSDWGAECARATRFLASLLLGLTLAGCGSTPDLPSTAAAATAGPEQAAAAPVEPLPPEAVQQFDQAVIHMNAGDIAAAEQGFRALAAAYPTYSGALLNLGILQAKANRLDDAEKTLRSALERNSSNAAAFNQLGIVYRKLGRFREADESYQHAVQVDPQYALAWLNLGVLCDLYLQQPERALEAFERYLTLAASPDAKVNTWVSELKKRIGAGAEPRAARAE